jgi:hypothetical protein
MKVSCKNCAHGRAITPEVRLGLGQENKEILNRLLASRYRVDEFRYCEKTGYLESAISRKECEEWDPPE